MRIRIHAPHFSVTDALRRYTDRRLRFALAFCDTDIRKVSVRLSDSNGPRGGVDKCCKLQVALVGLQDVRIEDIDADLYVAIDRATQRAALTVGRRLTRRRDRARTVGLHNSVSMTE